MHECDWLMAEERLTSHNLYFHRSLLDISLKRDCNCFPLDIRKLQQRSNSKSDLIKKFRFCESLFLIHDGQNMENFKSCTRNSKKDIACFSSN